MGTKLALWKRCLAEGLGTLFLVTAVVGSGIMAERISGNEGLALLANTLATGGALLSLILTFAKISGAHFNPAVSLLTAALRKLPARDAFGYVVAQCLGGFLGVVLAHAMFGLELLQESLRVRSGSPIFLSEIVATTGLLMIVSAGFSSRSLHVPSAVTGWIVGAYWFTASTSFANPAVTLARALTQTFAGIRPQDVPVFLAAQLVACGLAYLLARTLFVEPLAQPSRDLPPRRDHATPIGEQILRPPKRTRPRAGQDEGSSAREVSGD